MPGDRSGASPALAGWGERRPLSPAHPHPEGSMTTRLEELLTNYEHGSLTRRELLGALAAMVAMPAVAAAAAPLPPAIGRVRVLNHVTVRVTDVKKSAAFYQSLLGLSVLTPQTDGVNLATGGS